jgi:Tol biopolymer transport system component
MVGERLGRYIIEERLGAGGMGTVYRAHDPQLQRDVAIKVVTRAPEGDEKRAALAEARAASALNHPNVCTVYEVGEEGTVGYIVAEFIEGRPLDQLIPPQGLPHDTLVHYAIQIADALAHAHDHGVIHSDLKSSNVLVTRTGRAKVLDFGLARRIEASSSERETSSHTVATDPPRLVGTIAYMAPEQLLGQRGDFRSDVWSLGVLLHEMASGALPFQGRNQFELTASILRGPPAPLPPHVPPMLRAIIARCLAKDPDQRYQRASETHAALEAIQSDVARSIEPGPLPAARRRVPRTIAAVAAIAGIAGIAGIAAVLLVRRERERQPTPWARMAEAGRLTQLLASDTVQFQPVVSPDARLLAYTEDDANGRTDVYVRQTAGGRPIRLTVDEARESAPSFSPDGQQVAFGRWRAVEGQPEVCLMPALGGDLRCMIRGGTAPAWSPSGNRLAFLRPAGGGNAMELVTAHVDGSDQVVVLRGDGGYPFLRNPAWSPDARHIAIVRGSGGIAGELWLVPSEGGPPRRVSNDQASVFSDSPVFTPDGLGLVHSSNRGGATNIWFLPLDGGPPVRMTTGAGSDVSPSIARDGTIVFANTRWRNTLVLHTLDSRQSETLATHSPFIWAPVFSPDGRTIVFSRAEVDGSWHLWTIGPEGAVSRLTDTPQGEVYPRFTPDGAALLYHTWTSPRSVWRVPITGGPPERLAHVDGGSAAYADMSTDGRWIAYARSEADSERIYIVGASGGAARLLLPGSATLPRWSPDGRRIAYSPHRGYNAGIFVVDAAGRDPVRLADDGGWPVWWPDGRQVAYIAIGADGAQELRVVPSGGGPWRRLEGLRFLGTNHPFDVARDLRRLITSNAEHVSDQIWMLQGR